MLTGIGLNNFGEGNLTDLNGVSKISAGISTSMVVYNNGNVTGYGTNQAKNNTPNVSNSGVDVRLKGHIGTILKTNQDIQQWVAPWDSEGNNIIKPSYLQNNVVAISQGVNFTAAIFKRPASTCVIVPQVITGQQYLWKVTYVGGTDSYGGISLNDLYTGGANVIQPCDCSSFSLPIITSVG